MNARIETPPVADVAPRLGLEVRRGRISPCPACRAADKRGVITFGGPRWRCTRCNEGGDAVNLVAFVIAGTKKAYREAFAWLREQNQIAPSEPTSKYVEPRRLPSAEVLGVLKACTPVARTRDPRVLAWLAGRPTPLDPSRVPAAVLPGPDHPVYRDLTRFEFEGRKVPWWPSRWATTYPIVVPAWTGTGELAGFHARAVEADAPRKSSWPLGGDFRALLFADPVLGRGLLRGTASPERVLIVEGLPDYLYACQEAPPGVAVLGLESGSAPALKLVRFPAGCRIFCSAHDDDAGDRYAAQVAEALTPRAVFRVPLQRVTPRVAA